MDYSKLSDFEINARVRFGGMKDFKVSGEYCSFIGPEGDTYGIGPYHYKKNLPDYCKSWADAGPIIEANMICLAADVFAEPQDGGKWVAQPAYGWDSERVRSDNPLRACMIVYLMMQEGK